MSKPGTRRFIGPLTPAQQRRRAAARERFRKASSCADARDCSIRDALLIVTRGEPFVNWSPMRGDSYP